MSATKSDIAEYHCLYIQGAVAYQTPGILYDSTGILWQHYFQGTDFCDNGMELKVDFSHFKMSIQKLFVVRYHQMGHGSTDRVF